MSRPSLTRYSVDELVAAHKTVWKTLPVTDLGSRKDNPSIRLDLRRVDSPNIEIGLIFEAHSPRKPLPGVASVRRPSASLLWRGERVRGIDWTIKHEVIFDGVPTGEVIRGWHEHYWTDKDGTKSLRAPRSTPKNSDLSALISWCCSEWNIEDVPEPMRLFL